MRYGQVLDQFLHEADGQELCRLLLDSELKKVQLPLSQ
jgi:hypothetical protein